MIAADRSIVARFAPRDDAVATNGMSNAAAGVARPTSTARQLTGYTIPKCDRWIEHRETTTRTRDYNVQQEGTCFHRAECKVWDSSLAVDSPHPGNELTRSASADTLTVVRAQWSVVRSKHSVVSTQ